MDNVTQPTDKDMFTVKLIVHGNGTRTFKVDNGQIAPPIPLVKEVLDWGNSVVMNAFIAALVDQKLNSQQVNGLIKPEVVLPRKDIG